MKNLTREQFLYICSLKKDEELRQGQKMWSELSRINDEMAQLVTNTNKDPFNEDKNIPSFIGFIANFTIFD